MRRLILLVLLALLPGWHHTRALAEETAKTTTVLLTHPRERELRNIAGLVERGLLKVPGLRLVGIHHAQEYEDYDDSREYTEGKAPDWIELESISCDLAEDKLFEKNGCTPVFEKLFAESAAVIFTGGPDIQPRLYGIETRLTTRIEDPPRHLFEISFLAHLVGSRRAQNNEALLRNRPDYVILGLCLGMQSLNVASGGTLIQDIPSMIYGIKTLEDGQKLPRAKTHRSFLAPLDPAPGVGWAAIHPVRFVRKSVVTRTLLPEGRVVNVVSLHHQAVGRLGKGLEVLATSLDGKVIEALVHRKYPAVIGVQFHPERSILWDAEHEYRKSPGSAEHNYVAAWFAGDEKARAFHEAFWKMISEWIVKSAGQ